MKNVSVEESKKSFAINKTLTEQQAKDDDFKNNFRFFKEPLVFSLAPKISGTQFDSGAGMIVREIPQGLINGDYRLMPVFALYGTGVTSEDIPYLLTMSRNRADLDREIENKLIKPFAADWVKAAIEWGITTESHGQNLLVELDQEGKLNGRLWYRDLDGFDVATPSRKQRDLPGEDTLKPATIRELEISLRYKFGLLLTQLQRTVDSWDQQKLINADQGYYYQDYKGYELMLKLALLAELGKFAGENYNLKPSRLEPVEKDRWYEFYCRSVIQLQLMRANDRAAKTNSTDMLKENADDLRFGIEITKGTIDFLGRDLQGNVAQKDLANSRLLRMQNILKLKSSFEGSIN
ncbi:MAG: hypothetical protein BWZ03_00694 [bacterium ADurb.BinA186]|nr:MAG: hypothetical protein BWZ03_00694 [bacterium ADurb.BinA186]